MIHGYNIVNDLSCSTENLKDSDWQLHIGVELMQYNKSMVENQESALFGPEIGQENGIMDNEYNNLAENLKDSDRGSYRCRFDFNFQ